MLIYPLVADVPEVAVFIGYILLFDRIPLLVFLMPFVWFYVNDKNGITTNENTMKKEGAGV